MGLKTASATASAKQATPTLASTQAPAATEETLALELAVAQRYFLDGRLYVAGVTYEFSLNDARLMMQLRDGNNAPVFRFAGTGRAAKIERIRQEASQPRRVAASAPQTIAENAEVAAAREALEIGDTDEEVAAILADADGGDTPSNPGGEFDTAAGTVTL